jgi:hypothetical protein
MLSVTLVERDRERLDDPDADPDRLVDMLALGVGVAVRVRVALEVSVAEVVSVAVFDGDTLPERDVDALIDGDTGLTVVLAVRLAERDVVGLLESDTVTEGLAEKLALGVGVAERVSVVLAESVAERVGVMLLEGVKLPERVMDALTDADAVLAALLESDGDADLDIDGSRETETDGEPDADRQVRAMARTRLLPQSATKMLLPAPSTATPCGKLNVAALPKPLAWPLAAPPALPPPATVVTAPVLTTMARIRLLP